MGRAPIEWVAIAGIAVVILVAMAGGNAQASADWFSRLLLWMLPGAMIGAICGAVAGAIAKEVKVALGVGVSATVIYVILRALVFLA